jgi:3-oxoadipate enol-lactonase
VPTIEDDIAHRIDGPRDAPVVVLSNSLATTWSMWDPQLPSLLHRYRVVRYDHRGHGSSPPLRRAVATEDLAGEVVAVMDRLRVDRASFCGLSLGGMVGLRLAAEFPERVDRLVVCSTSAHLDASAFWHERADLVRRTGLDDVAEGVVDRWFTPAFVRTHADAVERARAMIRTTDPSSYARFAELLAGLDLRDAIGTIRAPTLVVAGAEDAAIPARHADVIAGAIDGASSVRIDDAAHLPNLERPDVFTDLLLSHLAGGPSDDGHPGRVTDLG